MALYVAVEISLKSMGAHLWHLKVEACPFGF